MYLNSHPVWPNGLRTNWFWVRVQFQILCRDVESNPVPGYWTSLSFCHWNLSSISPHDFVKVSLLEAYNATHKFDIICLSLTFLNSSLQNDDDILVLNGCKLVRSDNPSDLKREGVCIYLKEILPIKVLSIINVHECLVCEFPPILHSKTISVTQPI